MVPLVGAPPGQHFLAMASMAPMAPIAPMPSVGVAVPFPNAPMASETEVPCQSFDRQEVSLEPQEVDPGVEKVSDLSNQGNQGDRGQGGQGDQGGQGGQGEGDQSSQPLLGAQMACQREEFPKLRKKPTRRGGKRARHRPCHAAGAAMEWASSVGSAETPSFGEPGSGEEAEGEDELDGPDPKALDSVPVSKPRSFYPLAARLRVASAGQKPKGADEPNAIAEGSKGKPKESGCDEVEWAIKEPEEWPVRRIEAIEEVEPEPASASDVSDLPQREPARKGLQSDLRDLRQCHCQHVNRTVSRHSGSVPRTTSSSDGPGLRDSAGFPKCLELSAQSLKASQIDPSMPRNKL